VMEAGSKMHEPLEPLLRRRWDQRCRSPLSHCYGGGGVKDVRAPQAVAVAEVGSMMPEPLEPLVTCEGY
jgi:hypothetical protein